MSNIWRESADPAKHRDFMSTRNEGGVPIEGPRDNLIEQWVYFAQVADFTFEFVTLEQVAECRRYFMQPVHHSTREQGHSNEHCWHAWYCKLPDGLNKGRTRVKVIKALNAILTKWG
uniref:hypothetical protein n=1 Tax=Thaumasiovibrio occultus TaxID=1891184 RepID=UPI000B350611|nr:hypothetical protein [Thaumasiovibrio occultus]